MESATNTEYFLVRKTAEEYRNRGYEVSLEATLDFLPGFRADLVVRKDGETKVIEVKSRSSLAANPKIRELAEIVESKPGWSFELLLVAEPEKLESPDGERPLERGHILQRIEEAEHLLAAGHSDAAFLLAWAACEAAIRMLIAEHGGSGNGITTTNHLVNQATYLGILSREEYRHLARVQKYRNAVAHGYSHDDVGKGLISDLVESVRQMATEIDA